MHLFEVLNPAEGFRSTAPLRHSVLEALPGTALQIADGIGRDLRDVHVALGDLERTGEATWNREMQRWERRPKGIDLEILALLTAECLLAERVWHLLQMEGPKLPVELLHLGTVSQIYAALYRLYRDARAKHTDGVWRAVDLPIEVRAANLEVAQAAAIDVLGRKERLMRLGGEG